MSDAFMAMLLDGLPAPLLGASLHPAALAPPPAAALPGIDLHLDDFEFSLGGTEFQLPALPLAATMSAEARAEAAAASAHASLAQWLLQDVPPPPKHAAEPLLAPTTQLRRWKKARAPHGPGSRGAEPRAYARALATPLRAPPAARRASDRVRRAFSRWMPASCAGSVQVRGRAALAARAASLGTNLR